MLDAKLYLTLKSEMNLHLNTAEYMHYSITILSHTAATLFNLIRSDQNHKFQILMTVDMIYEVYSLYMVCLTYTGHLPAHRV